MGCDLRAKLYEWGKWARDNEPRQTTPLYSMMRAAGCFNVLRMDYNITDDEALVIDSAVQQLRRDYLLLGEVLVLHFVGNWSYRRIALDYLTPIEYPSTTVDGWGNVKGKQVNHRTAARLINSAIDMVTHMVTQIQQNRLD